LISVAAMRHAAQVPDSTTRAVTLSAARRRTRCPSSVFACSGLCAGRLRNANSATTAIRIMKAAPDRRTIGEVLIGDGSTRRILLSSLNRDSNHGSAPSQADAGCPTGGAAGTFNTWLPDRSAECPVPLEVVGINGVSGGRAGGGRGPLVSTHRPSPQGAGGAAMTASGPKAFCGSSVSAPAGAARVGRRAIRSQSPHD
jgi:hypothetical protein